MKILITGATGFIGRHLCKALAAEKHELRVLTRDLRGIERRLQVDARAYEWNAVADPPPLDALDGIDAIIHLAGEPISDGRWNAERKRRIRESRVLSTENLMAAVASLRHKPEVVLSGSAIGYYGDRGDDILTESSAGGSDFMARICQDWEDAARKQLEGTGVRLVFLRTGLVLGKDGGLLKKFGPLTKAGIFGPLGRGKQWMSWIHIDDYVRIVLQLLTSPKASGPFNLTAPEPRRNRDFAHALGAVLHRPTVIPTPTAALRLILGSDAAEAFVASQRVLPQNVLEVLKYEFRYPSLPKALEALYSENGTNHRVT